MEMFECKECNSDYGWVLEYKDEKICVYCKGKYEDGTICKSGNKK